MSEESVSARRAVADTARLAQEAAKTRPRRRIPARVHATPPAPGSPLLSPGAPSAGAVSSTESANKEVKGWLWACAKVPAAAAERAHEATEARKAAEAAKAAAMWVEGGKPELRACPVKAIKRYAK